MTLKKWFRVELDDSGAILSCVEVEAAERGNKRIRFVEAISKAEACSKAKSWAAWLNSWNAQRDDSRYRFAKENGICVRCHKSNAQPGKTRCEPCAKSQLESLREVRKQKRLGTYQPPPKRSDEERYASMKASGKKSRNARGAHSYILRKILSQLDTLGPTGFRAWLVSELKRIDSKFIDTVNVIHAEAAE